MNQPLTPGAPRLRLFGLLAAIVVGGVLLVAPAPAGLTVPAWRMAALFAIALVLWATEAIRPGVVGLSHHMGRWMQDGHPGSRWVMGKVKIDHDGDIWSLRYTEGVKPFESEDPDSSRIYWDDPGVHQNLAFPVQPDPVSGMHCWHQKVTVERARPGDRYGDVRVDTAKAREVYARWKAMTRPGPGPEGQRRPEFMMRHVPPTRAAYRLPVPTMPGGES